MATSLAVSATRLLHVKSSKILDHPNFKKLQREFIRATTVNALKRSRGLSGLDDGDLATLPPTKKSKTGLDIFINSKSTSSQSVLQAVRNTKTRPIKPLPKRRFLQSAKPALSSVNSIPAHVGAARASAGRWQTDPNGGWAKLNRVNAVTVSNRSSLGLSSATSQTTRASHRENSKPFRIQHRATTRPPREFSIYQATADEELENILSHSAHRLEISEDDERSDPGKENVPPPGYVAGTRKTRTKRRMRAPLKNLDEGQSYYVAKEEEL